LPFHSTSKPAYSLLAERIFLKSISRGSKGKLFSSAPCSSTPNSLSFHYAKHCIYKNIKFN
jgi:hypothetical protein